MDRTQELVDLVLGEFAALNIGPGRGVPTKTIIADMGTLSLTQAGYDRSRQ